MAEKGAADRPVIAAGLALGIGMGGFVDGILFHQILQLHNMLSARVSTAMLVGAKVNMVWDGVFHAFVWAMTLAGIVLLWRAATTPGTRLSGRVLAGACAAGWGTFNVVEGLVDHHLLHLHHVVEWLGQSAWDWAFLASGVVLILGGAALVRRGRAGPAMIAGASGTD